MSRAADEDERRAAGRRRPAPSLRSSAALLFSAALIALASTSAAACRSPRHAPVAVPAPPSVSAPQADAFLEDLSHRTFRWFWDLADPKTALVPDRAPTKSFSSVAAVGFGLTAYTVGAERGWVTRADAAQRAAKTLRFLVNAPDGDAARGMTRYCGF